MVYDCVVLGVGGMGSFAFRSAAQRGWKTLGLEKFGPAHDRGSSHGRTRIIRTAYFEHPHYVPLAQRSWEHWQQLQLHCDVPLIQQTGLLQVGPEDGIVVPGVIDSAKKHSLAVEKLTAPQAIKRFPAFQLPHDAACVFEHQTGYLQVENCVAHAIRLGLQAGGEFRGNTSVQQISIEADGLVLLRIDGERIRSERLIVCAGPWAPDFLNELNIDIRVTRQQQHWFQLDRIDIKRENGFPAFLIEDDDGCFYGLPEIDYLGMKVADHSPGSQVSDPDHLDRECDLDDRRRAEAFMDRYLNFSRRRLVHHSVCMYSNSEDKDFIIDRHPDSERVVFAAGLSGHGFKFAPVIGERLVGMLEGQNDELFDFLSTNGRNLGTAS